MLSRALPVLRRTVRVTGGPARYLSSGGGGGGGGNTGLFLLAAGGAAAGYYYYTTQSHPPAAVSVNYDAVRGSIAQLIEDNDEGEGIGPILVRLAWHASGTYSKSDNSGGSEGATMRFSPEKDWGANAGLQIARDLLEPIKAKYPGITYADLWTLAGAVAIEEMAGPRVAWQPGRTDSPAPGQKAEGARQCPKAIVEDGRLPDATQGAQHLRDVFYRMGFNDRDIVALSGAHALGRCHKDRSGFEGPWTRAPTTFSNMYFTELFEQKWVPKKKKDPKWDGEHFYVDDATGELMMLPTDLSIIQDKEFKKYAREYADDEEAFFRDFSNAFGKLLELGVRYQ